MEASYRLSVEFRVPSGENWHVDPDTFATTLVRPAQQPGEEGWLFFRDHLWRGDLSDPDHVVDVVEDALEVHVEDVEYRAFETDGAYYDALREAIEADLEAFNADSSIEVLNKYFGSTVERTR